jgi:hypothetical protein
MRTDRQIIVQAYADALADAERARTQMECATSTLQGVHADLYAHIYLALVEKVLRDEPPEAVGHELGMGDGYIVLWSDPEDPSHWKAKRARSLFAPAHVVVNGQNHIVYSSESGLKTYYRRDTSHEGWPEILPGVWLQPDWNGLDAQRGSWVHPSRKTRKLPGHTSVWIGRGIEPWSEEALQNVLAWLDRYVLER